MRLSILVVDLFGWVCFHSGFFIFTHVRLIHISKNDVLKKFTDDFTRLFVMPLGTCRVSFIFLFGMENGDALLSVWMWICACICECVYRSLALCRYPWFQKLNCSQSNGTYLYRIFSNIRSSIQQDLKCFTAESICDWIDLMSNEHMK